MSAQSALLLSDQSPVDATVIPDENSAVVYPDGTKYIGDWQGDKYHGRGTLWNNANESYDGSFCNGVYDGEGLLVRLTEAPVDARRSIWEDRPEPLFYDAYEGTFRNGQKHGYGFEMHLESFYKATVEKRYEGSFRNGLPDGYGASTQEHLGTQGPPYGGFGERYAGTYAEGQREGTGVLTEYNTAVDKSSVETPHYRYEGGFYKGHKQGRAVEMTKGMLVECTFAQDKRVGAAKIKNPDGSRFEGAFRDDGFSAYGTMVWPDGRTYSGETSTWVYGDCPMRPFGTGKETSPDGGRFTGTFNYSGWSHGVRVDADGRRREGAFSDQALTGKGVEVLPDGTRREGEFQRGVLHGQGVETLPAKKKRAGNFRNGKYAPSLRDRLKRLWHQRA